MQSEIQPGDKVTLLSHGYTNGRRGHVLAVNKTHARVYWISNKNSRRIATRPNPVTWVMFGRLRRQPKV